MPPHWLCRISSSVYIPVILLLTTMFITLEILSKKFKNMLHMFLSHYSLPRSLRFGSQPLLVLLPTKYGFTHYLVILATIQLFKRYLLICSTTLFPMSFRNVNWKVWLYIFKWFPTPVLGSVSDDAPSALWVNRIPFPLAGMLPHEVKINNVNSSSLWGTLCGLSVGEDMALKGEVGKDRQSFRR